MGGLAKDIRLKPLIAVPQDISDPCNQPPGNLRLPRLYIVWDMAACLGDDFDAAFHQPALPPVTLECIEIDIGNNTADMLDCLDNIR